MKRNWVKGWNGGLTGPNTPAAPTVGYRIAHRVWEYDKTGKTPYPSCEDYYIPIAEDDDTVAIAVGPDREATAELIAKAPQLEEQVERMERALISILSVSHPTIDKEIRAIAKEALR